VDVHTPEQRSHNMRRVRSKGSKAELIVRRALHAAGLRYRLHRTDLPGSPDLVFSRQRAVVFIHGCFWHGHGCGRSRLPNTRRDFWSKKIEGNRARDRRVSGQLLEGGWRVLTVWECAIRGPGNRTLCSLTDQIMMFIAGEEVGGNLPGLE
jgi:DNA mismatch endonuclease (patch repair protein)